MAREWKLRGGQVKVVEDADTASLVVIGRNLDTAAEKVSALEAVLEKLRKSA
jgi:hypothetical protein